MKKNELVFPKINKKIEELNNINKDLNTHIDDLTNELEESSKALDKMKEELEKNNTRYNRWILSLYFT